MQGLSLDEKREPRPAQHVKIREGAEWEASRGQNGTFMYKDVE